MHHQRKSTASKQSTTPASAVPTSAPAQSEILDLAGAAALLHVQPQTLYSWTRSRSKISIPFRRIGKFIRFSRTELITWFSTLGNEKNVGRPAKAGVR